MASADLFRPLSVNTQTPTLGRRRVGSPSSLRVPAPRLGPILINSLFPRSRRHRPSSSDPFSWEADLTHPSSSPSSARESDREVQTEDLKPPVVAFGDRTPTYGSTTFIPRRPTPAHNPQRRPDPCLPLPPQGSASPPDPPHPLTLSSLPERTTERTGDGTPLADLWNRRTTARRRGVDECHPLDTTLTCRPSSSARHRGDTHKGGVHDRLRTARSTRLVDRTGLNVGGSLVGAEGG